MTLLKQPGRRFTEAAYKKQQNPINTTRRFIEAAYKRSGLQKATYPDEKPARLIENEAHRFLGDGQLDYCLTKYMAWAALAPSTTLMWLASMKVTVDCTPFLGPS